MRALLIIDVQNDYFPFGKYELHAPEAALDAIKDLLKYFREKNLPVFYVQHISEEDADFFVPGTEGAEIHRDIAPQSGEKVIIKHEPNSFYETALQDELKESGVTELVVCGMMTHMCIDTTVRAAKDYGYHMILIEDACATRDLEWKQEWIPAKTVQKVFMASLNQEFACVQSSAEFLEEQ